MFRIVLFTLLSCTVSIAVAADQRAQTKQEIAQAAKDIAELKNN